MLALRAAAPPAGRNPVDTHIPAGARPGVASSAAAGQSLAAVTAALLLPAAAAGAPFLAPFAAYETGGVPVAIEAGHLDGDGLPDLVMADVIGDRIVVLRARVDGSHEVGGSSGVPNAPADVALAHLDGDGRLDAVVACMDAGVLAVLPGRGDGSFGAATPVASLAVPVAVTVADLEGDDRADLVALLASDGGSPGALAVVVRRADGGWEPPAVIATGGAPVDFRVADADQDGRADLVVANRLPDELVVLHGVGPGRYEISTRIPLDGAPMVLAVGDWNGDAWPDVAVAHTRFAPGGVVRRISVFLGGSTGFERQPDLYTIEHAIALESADLDADGSADLVSLGTVAWVYLGRGDGRFATLRPFEAGGEPWAMTFADLTGDGNLDLATAAVATQGACVLSGNGDGTFGLVAVLTGYLPQSVALRDLDGDAVLDLVVANQLADVLTVHRGLGTGGFGAGRDHPTARDPAGVAVADVDGDGALDLLAVSFDQEGVGFLSVLRADGAGGWLPHADVPLAAPATIMALGDWNGDQHVDVAAAVWTADWPADGAVHVLLGRGDGSFDDAGLVAVGPLPMGLGAFDVDGDADLDLVATYRMDATGPNGGASILHGHGDGTFTDRQDVATGDDPRGVAAGDLDGDGKLDLVVANSGYVMGVPGSLTVLLGRGGGAFERAPDVPTGTGSWALVLADFDRDGRQDVAVTNASANTVSVLLGAGDGSFGGRFDVGTGSRPVGLAAGDLDGDSRPDLATANSGGTSVTLLFDRIVATPIAVVGLVATPSERGARLAWTLPDVAPLRAVGVERAAREAGPFETAGGPLAPARHMTFEDPSPGPEAWYRLALQRLDGRVEWSPVVALAGASRGFGLEVVRAAGGGIRVRHRSGSTGGTARLEIVNVAGRRVRLLEDGLHAPGEHEIAWDAADGRGRRVARGVYWVRWMAGGRQATRKVVLVGE
jgi:hypothetical protein